MPAVCFCILHVCSELYYCSLFFSFPSYGHTCYMYHTVPSAPQNVTVHSRSAHNLTITWSLPSAPRGNPNYTIRYIETSMASTLNVSMWNGTSAAAGQLSVMILGLKPFTEYSVRVAAETTCGRGDYSEPLVERTGEAPSGPPTYVTVVASLPTSIVISWEAPAEPRGNITGYNVRSARVVEYC